MTAFVGAGLHRARTTSPFVGGQGVWLHRADGTRVLDASNTGGPLGHAHPLMVEALHEAASFPVANESRDWAEREEVAAHLVDIVDAGEGWVGGVRFGLSGSEVNDIALSLAQAATGRAPLVARERAYHGLVGLSRDVTVQPQWHGGLSNLDGDVLPPQTRADVRVVAGPDGTRWSRTPADRPNGLLPGELQRAVDGAAAVIVDYTQGGRYYDPAYQDAVADAASEAGAWWIADEVVTGLGRCGRAMAFHGSSSRPDVVTLGKPLAGGASAAGAVVLSRRITDLLEDAKWQNYSTFRAHPVTVHAIGAHLAALEKEQLVERAAAAGDRLGAQLVELAKAHPSVVRVAGEGLHWTVELDGPDWKTWDSTLDTSEISDVVVGEALGHGVAISTSDEPSSLFLAPALIIENEELDMIVDALDAGLTRADERLGR
ncbi:aminotransferase class III-fold pyridoxal phosphate-dependent enzyme [Aeromicrobium alkaliterrae]|uniref:Aspartate aminotransferase family protein n=1 Tax=Aeromicrobium alkaliterrae TaxID=302168 RepID=A0ABN2JNL6_9ACTN